jgi:spoIIIJ-associated protein
LLDGNTESVLIEANMSQEKTTLEIIAPSVEEAVAKGLSQLGLPEDAVDIEVLDVGNKGFLGLGTRQARIRLLLKGSDPQPAVPARKRAPSAARTKEKTEEVLVKVEKPDERPSEDVSLSSDDARVLEVAEQVTGELLEKMRVRARLKTQILPPQDENDQSMVMVEVQGDDLSILIGRRSETLNALQYITSLIVAKEVGHWVPLMIDVQGYRARRERQLRVLARRMAEQVTHTNKKMALEPMPANERRIIHLELRDHEDVVTESSGEEPNRKVVIYPKKPAIP